MKTALLLSHEEIQMFILIKPRTIIHTIENLEEVVFTISSSTSLEPIMLLLCMSMKTIA